MSFDYNMKGKLALITGASRGIGLATAEALAGHGCNLILNSFSDFAKLSSVGQEISSKYGVKTECLKYDVSDEDAVKNTFMNIHKNYKKIDILVNNAGVLLDNLIPMINRKDLDRTLDVNVKGIIFHLQYASRLMQKFSQGSIVNVSSIIGRFGNEGQVVYAASKSAVIGITQSASKELGPFNIRVNTVAPGFIYTDMTKALSTDKFEERMNSIKMKRIGKAEEVANAILFLASDYSSYITGQVLGVDGGMLI